MRKNKQLQRFQRFSLNWNRCNNEHSEMQWFDPAEAMQLPDLALDEYRSAFQQALPLIRQSL